MTRAAPMVMLAICCLGAAPAHSASEAPDTQPLTASQIRTRQEVYTALRIAGLLTTVGLVTLIGLLLYREHRRSQPPQEGSA